MSPDHLHLHAVNHKAVEHKAVDDTVADRAQRSTSVASSVDPMDSESVAPGDADRTHTSVPTFVDTRSGRVEVSPRPWTRALIGTVRLYQRARAGKPSPCRYTPSCSVYAVEALQVHGSLRGTWLAARRLGRCHPWGHSGYDPVPDPFHSTAHHDETAHHTQKVI